MLYFSADFNQQHIVHFCKIDNTLRTKDNKGLG